MTSAFPICAKLTCQLSWLSSSLTGITSWLIKSPYMNGVMEPKCLPLI